ncbi:hypothetical protein CC78DRAFT_378980 [Lojkania enalia]|uniref:Uncharacterized protein n=1 Tax=Lojkania enalia TaxID=147567 RepID=A0A9P4KGB1_9PLEO|nr:hypothetical protein CC78DRAFT_378980 [Didymosphaeria enalia]
MLLFSTIICLLLPVITALSPSQADRFSYQPNTNDDSSSTTLTSTHNISSSLVSITATPNTLVTVVTKVESTLVFVGSDHRSRLNPPDKDNGPNWMEESWVQFIGWTLLCYNTLSLFLFILFWAVGVLDNALNLSLSRRDAQPTLHLRNRQQNDLTTVAPDIPSITMEQNTPPRTDQPLEHVVYGHSNSAPTSPPLTSPFHPDTLQDIQRDRVRRHNAALDAELRRLGMI